MHTTPSEDSTNRLVFMEGIARRIRCVGVGGYPLPEIRVFLGNKEVTGMFQLTSSVSLEGARGLRLIKYRTERTTDHLAFTAHDDELPIRCVVTVPGIAANRTHVNINVLHRPMIACPSVVAHLGDQDVALRCEVRARPRLVALFWVIDGNGTTLTDGKTYNEYWTMVVDRSDGVMETRLFMKRVFRQSFRRYTLIAENAISVSVAEAQLLQGSRSAKGVMQIDPPGNLALNDGSKESDPTSARSDCPRPDLPRFLRATSSILTHILMSRLLSHPLT